MTWTVEHSRKVMSQRTASDFPFAAEVALSLRTHKSGAVVSDALTCVSQETARVYATTGRMPSALLSRFVLGRCGYPYGDLQHISLVYDTTDAPDAVRANVADWVLAIITKVLESHPVAVGFGFAQVGTRVVAIGYGARSPRLKLTVPIQLEASEQGVVVVEGEVAFESAMAAAYINHGAQAVANCISDPSRALPAFRFTCTMAEGDATAWIQVAAQRSEKSPVSETLLEVLAVRHAPSVDTMSVDEASPSEEARSPKEFEERALAVINAARAAARRKPLALLAKQSDRVRALAPHYFQAYLASEDRGVLDTILSGLLAGWDVEQTIRVGRAFSNELPTRDPEQWIACMFERPGTRWALLDPGAQAIALGATLDDKHHAAVLGFIYSFFEGHDHARDAALVAARIERARAINRLPLARPDAKLDQVAWRAAERVRRTGVAPGVAIDQALPNLPATGNRRVWGLVLVGREPDVLQLPSSVLSPRVKSIAVSSSHYRPPGSHWGVQVYFIVLEETPGGDA